MRSVPVWLNNFWIEFPVTISRKLIVRDPATVGDKENREQGERCAHCSRVQPFNRCAVQRFPILTF